MIKSLLRAVVGIMAMALYVESGLAQSTPPEISAILPPVTPPSPNAASLGTFGQVPVSLFNGLPQISIPLGNVTLDEVNVDISLSYHGGGINPEQHPGWVGLGWNLNAGGAITRRVNGRVDESLDPNPPETKFNYYNNFNQLDISNWYTSNNLNLYGPYNPTILGDPAPDEFMFNFGNYSGSFYYDHKGKWQVKSESPVYMKVEEVLGTDFILKALETTISSDLSIKRIFYKFTLTTPDGTQYIFGGDKDAIEFTRNVNPSGDGLYHNNVVATTWYLTQIITKVGRKINFKYKREDIIASQSSSSVIFSYNENGANVKSSTNPSAKSISVINPCYLNEITAPSQRVAFEMDHSIELPYNFEQATLDLLKGYEDFKNTRVNVNTLFKWKQLEIIEFYSTGNTLLKSAILRFSNDANSRLMLKGVDKTNTHYDAVESYQFDYDTTSLPPYNAQKNDHWGYYNGVNFFNSKPNTYTYTKADIPDYIASRAPNATLMKAGVLTGIRYPTGGYTKFEYEPHAYHLVAKRYPFTVDSVNGNLPCGGLRIRKITDTAFPGSVPVVKEYFYVKDYNLGGNVSSGILAGNPVYLDEGSKIVNGKTISYWYWYDYAIQPLSNTNGNHITYSEVVEKSADGSYVINNYANHDQAQYLDQAMLGGIYPISDVWNLDPNTSMSLDRGKVLRKRYFKANKTLIKDTKYEYDESAARYNNNVRIINLSLRNYGFARDFRATAYLIYTFPRYLTKETDITYDQNGANQVSTVNSYTYDNLYRLLKSSTLVDSKGHSRTNVYNYPPDYAPLQSDNPTVYTEMLNRNMISTPIETSSAVNYSGSNKVTAARLQLFAKDAVSGDILPAKILSLNISNPITDYTPTSINTYTEVINGVTKKTEKLVYDNRFDTIIYFDKYDTSGNLLQMHKSGDQNISFLWGYNGLYPVAKVSGSDYTTISGMVNSDTLQNPPGDLVLRDKLNNIRKNIPAPAMVFTYTYAPITGVTSETDPAGKTTYYEYDNYQRLKRIKDHDGKILKEYDYQYQATLTPNWKTTGRKNCITGTGGYLTGEQQQEEQDINPYSYTYDSLRWTKKASPDCPVVADWRATGVKRCATDGFDHYTGEELAEQKDLNPYSPTYNTTKWLSNGQTAACNITPNWQPTGNYSCLLDAWGSNTGNQSVQQKDMNPLSVTYNTTQWVTKPGGSTCPVIQGCVGLGYRAIKNVCEHGTVTVSGTIIQDVPRKWKCTFTIKYSYGPNETVETFSSDECRVIED